MQSKENTIENLRAMAKRMRKKLLDTSLAAGASSSHFGGGLSLIEITATLFGTVMKYDSKNPTWIERDRFILSKGHGCLGYYMALYEAGFITDEDLENFEKTDAVLIGHPVMNRAKGIEFSNGSLGMGLSLGIGVALAGKKRNLPYTVYVVMGDGECNEGSVWEALMSAAHLKLNNIVVVVDHNRFQQTGSNAEILNTGNLFQKFLSFGWDVFETDGHDVGKLYDIFMQEKHAEKPRMIVAHTIKGKGFSFSENNNDWHHKVLTKEQYQIALEELNRAAEVV